MIKACIWFNEMRNISTDFRVGNYIFIYITLPRPTINSHIVLFQ